ncbi:hypothetical protein H2200_000428 [Cladophialophora chaetospira]|uniref:Uncharacterized protein n=1 Tax=Cladophialophora chaetospira TaxID=386627 RepID=A0AA38XPF5_9EURO|nr:hypothetical protein H2200_000428 [Cladophialophora chaetospira]
MRRSRTGRQEEGLAPTIDSLPSPTNSSSIPLQKLSPAKILRFPVVPKRRWASFELRRSWQTFTQGWWLWELLASALSFAATIALIVTLAITDGHEQQSYGIARAKLTLNAIVAAISTVIRTALMFAVSGALSQNAWNWYSSKRSTENLNPGKPLRDLDTFADAGSDPLAGLTLIWRTRGKALATVGATLTLLSLAFDTFAQQVLTTRTRPTQEVGSEGNSSLATALPRAMTYIGQAPSSVGTFANPPIPVEAAVLSSLLATNTSQPVGRCPTGDCSWPLTPSLGVCGSCIDSTNQMSLNKPLLPDTAEYSISDALDKTLLDMSLADWVQFAGLHSVYPFHKNKAADGRLVVSHTQILGVPPPKYHSFLQAVSEAPTNTTIIHVPEEKVTPLMTAYTCSIYFCIQAFEAKATAGSTSQSPRHTWDQFAYVDGFWRPVDVPGTMNLTDPSEYRVENRSLNVLGDVISNVLVGHAQVWYSDVPSPLTQDLPAPNFVGQQSSGLGTFAQAVWEASNSTASINTFFENAAQSFTNFMRTAPSVSAPDDEQYAPAVYTTEIYVHVRWGWLAFPLSVLLLSHVFLALTISQTTRRHVRPWKKARVPLLLAGLDDEIRQAAKGGLHSRPGLENVVGQTNVRLKYDDGDQIVFERAS